MNLIVKPSRKITGRILLPPDTDIAQRAAVFSLLVAGKSTLDNWPDTVRTDGLLACLRQLGAGVNRNGTVVEIDGIGENRPVTPDSPLDCGDAEAGFWLLYGILAGGRISADLRVPESVLPVVRKSINAGLAQMGATVNPGNGEERVVHFAPASLPGGEINISSLRPHLKHVLSMASIANRCRIIITEETPAPDSLERILPAYGLNPEISRPRKPRSRREAMLEGIDQSEEIEKFHKRMILSPGDKALRPVDWSVPGSFNLAAGLIAAAAVRPKSELVLEDVGLNSSRTGLLRVLKRMGAGIEVQRRRMENGEPVGDITVKGGDLKSTKVGHGELSSMASEILLLAVAAGSANGVTVIRGVEKLQETGMFTISRVTEILRQFGVKLAELEDGWAIEGPTEWRAARVDCRQDFAIGMASAIAGLSGEKDTVLENADTVVDTFPGFQKLLLSLSGK